MTSGRGELLVLEVEEGEVGTARTDEMTAARSAEGRSMVSEQ